MEKKRPSPPIPLRLGNIVFVDKEGGFVLFETGSPGLAQTGTLLKTFHGMTESGEVRVTAERRNQFVSADVLRGDPQQGDWVMTIVALTGTSTVSSGVSSEHH